MVVPINPIPIEIVANILSMFEDPSVNSSSSRLRIAQVNHAWRELTLSTPSFWTRLTLAFNYGTDTALTADEAQLIVDSMELYRLHLKRTRGQPLSITIIILGSRQLGYDQHTRAQVIDAQLREVVLSAPRWTSLRLMSDAQLPAAVKCVLEQDFPSSLTYLSIRCCFPGKLPHIVLGGAIPPHLEIDTNVSIKADAYWPIVHAACLSGSPILGPHGTLEGLSNATSLSELYLAGLDEDRGNQDDTPLPSVRRLIWGRSNEGCWVNSLVLPSLETIELRGAQGGADLPRSLPRFNKRDLSTGLSLARMIQEGRVGCPTTVYLDAWTPYGEAAAVAAGLHNVIRHLTFGHKRGSDWHVIPVAENPALEVFPNLMTVSLPRTVHKGSSLGRLETRWRERDKTFGAITSNPQGRVISLIWPSSASQAAVNLIDFTIREIRLVHSH